MRTWAVVLLSVHLGLVAGCGGREVLGLPEEAGWGDWKVTGWHENTKQSVTMTWTKERATAGSAPEWVTYEVLPKPAWGASEAAMNRLRTLMDRPCGSGVWQALQEKGTETLYEGKAAHCPPDPDKVALARIIYGHTEMFLLVYISHGTEFSTAHRAEAIRLLAGARLEVAPESPGNRPGPPPTLRGGGAGRRRGGGGGA